jgi:adenylate kinase family enzyme
MERVIIIGSNGAGKSTFSYELSAKTKLPLIHIDKIYWRSCWEVTPREEFESIVLYESKKYNWIIEGNNIRSLDQRLQYADTVIWFEYPPILCVINILKREFKYRNKVRPDMPDECISKLKINFLNDVWKFNKKNHDKIELLLENTKNVEVIRFTNYRQVRKYIRSM